jgi:hypothetical protein
MFIKPPKIIAVDFDGCIATNEYPNIGAPIWRTIGELWAEQRKGSRIILWTCRKGKLLNDAVRWCGEHNIHFDAVNRNLPKVKKEFGGDTRKVFANEYWDDRAVKMPKG